MPDCRLGTQSSGFGVTRGNGRCARIDRAKVITTSRGRFRPESKHERPGDQQLFNAYLRLTHRTGWRNGLGAVLELLRQVINRPKQRDKYMKSSRTEKIGVIVVGLWRCLLRPARWRHGPLRHLFERNVWLGGKAAVLEGEGFRFDMGPTVLTIPSVLRAHLLGSGTETGRLPRSGSF